MTRALPYRKMSILTAGALCVLRKGSNLVTGGKGEGRRPGVFGLNGLEGGVALVEEE